jgi:hypothetical protein
VGGFLYICCMKTIDDRINNIVEWFKKNHNEINYVNYNNVHNYFINTNNPLRTDWDKVRYEKGSKYLINALSKNNISFKTKKEYDEIIFNKEMDTFKVWVINNQTKPDRLSYLAIYDYLKKNDENEMIKIWSKMCTNLKQKGLIEWFNQIGLTFYVQDNKKDLKKILNNLLLVAKKFYKETGYTPGWSELEKHGFNETKYLRAHGWNLYWQIDDLNGYYIKNNLPKVPSKSEMSVLDMKSMNVDVELEKILSFFGNIPSLGNLKSSEEFYDFCRYLHNNSYHLNKTENDVYHKLWENKYGKEYVKMARKLISLDGYWCDSMYELMFYNYLHLNGVKNNPHKPYCEIINSWETNYISDNVLPNGTVCEVAGYHPDKHEDYWIKIHEKNNMCDKNDIPFLLVEGYEFINTKLEDYLDYLHDKLSYILSNLKKPEFFMVIKSQHTVEHLKEIFILFGNEKHFTIEIIKEFLSKEAFRFFMNYFQSIKNFKLKYEKGFHKEFPEIKDMIIDFKSKTFSKVIGMSKKEKIENGIHLLAQLIKEKQLKLIPTFTDLEKEHKEYRIITDRFREDGEETYWLSIFRKEEGYSRLCKKLGYNIEFEITPKNYYSNINNLIDDLKHMKEVGNGYWVGVRDEVYKKDFRCRRIHNYINRELNGVNKFRTKYSKILSDIGFVYKGNNTKLMSIIQG